MTSRRNLPWLPFLGVLLFSAIIYGLVPDSTRDGLWTHNVLRNWKEYGFFHLGGKLVQNPGGHDAIDRPEIYTGHRAASLYVPYAVVYAAGGVNKGEFLFYLLFVTLILWTIWRFLGRTPAALSVGCVVVLSPGFTRSITNIDPLTIPVLFGLPVMAWLCECVESRKLRTGQMAIVAVVAIFYSQLNWTVVFPVAVTTGYLFAALGVSKRDFWMFCLILVGAMASTVVVSVLNKMNNAAVAATSNGWNTLYNAYLLGSGGYMGYGMNWLKAITRLAAANLIGLLPLLLIFGWTVWRASCAFRSFSWKAFLPLLTAILSIAAMRNYFAQHPWMASSVIVFGIVFSVRHLVTGMSAGQPDPRPAFAHRFRFMRPMIATACFLYCCLIVLILRMNSANEDALRSLVQQNTRRHDVVLVSSQSDPGLARNMVRLSQLFDRKVALLEHSSQTSEGLEGGFVLLSTNSKFGSSTSIARTRAAGAFDQDILRAVLEWYRRNIARRSKGDRLEVEDPCFLIPLSDKVPGQ